MRLPPLSVLCLHGYSQSGDALRSHTRRLVDLLSHRARFTFTDAPFPVPSVVDPQTGGFSWWLAERDSEGAWMYEGVDAALACLGEADAAERRATGAGFAGVLGFSQGGALASLCVALAENARSGGEAGKDRSGVGAWPPPPPLPDIRFAIFAGGFPYRAATPSYERVFRDLVPLRLPSAHAIGERDKIVKPETSACLHDLFADNADCVELHHRGGHIVPSDHNSIEALDLFLERRQRDALARLARDFGNGSYC